MSSDAAVRQSEQQLASGRYALDDSLARRDGAPATGDIARGERCELGVIEIAMARSGGAQRGDERLEHGDARAAGTKPDGILHFGGRTNVHPHADRDPLRSAVAPACFGEDASELRAADLQIVR